MLTFGTVVKLTNPQGVEDKTIATAKGDRCAVYFETTLPHGYARIAFYGDAKGLTYLVHPESLEIVYQSKKA